MNYEPQRPDLKREVSVRSYGEPQNVTISWYATILPSWALILEESLHHCSKATEPPHFCIIAVVAWDSPECVRPPRTFNSIAALTSLSGTDSLPGALVHPSTVMCGRLNFSEHCCKMYYHARAVHKDHSLLVLHQCASNLHEPWSGINLRKYRKALAQNEYATMQRKWYNRVDRLYQMTPITRVTKRSSVSTPDHGENRSKNYQCRWKISITKTPANTTRCRCGRTHTPLSELLACSRASRASRWISRAWWLLASWKLSSMMLPQFTSIHHMLL